MATVSIVHRLDKKNKKGLAPIHFRIIQNRKISYISSGILIPKDEWDPVKLRVTSKNKNSKRLTTYITNKYLELQSKILEQETFHKSLTSKKLKERIFGHEPLNIFQFADEFIEKYKEKGSIGTYDRCKAVMSKLEKYVGKRELFLQDIDVEFLTTYEKYLRTKLGNKINTIHTNFKFFRTLYNGAYRLGLIEHADIPFNKYKLVLEKTQRTYLTSDELMALQELQLNPGTKLSLHRDMFIFASYCGGIRISDMLLLKWKHFDGVHIQFTIKKTGSQLSIKLPEKALDILTNYQPKKESPGKFIFPVLPENLNISNPELLDIAISRGTALVNKSLNSLAKKAGITKHISFHISRHTWATQALRKGISIDKVSKLMGHANIRETQIYAKIVSEELDKAMDVFND